MILDRKIGCWRVGVSALLGIALVLISFGSRSPAFHDWIHGDQVICSLSHDSPVSEVPGGDSPEDQDHNVPDPLEPFCQSGYLLVCDHQDLVLGLPQIAETLQWHALEFLPGPLSLSPLSRAPPVFI